LLTTFNWQCFFNEIYTFYNPKPIFEELLRKLHTKFTITPYKTTKNCTEPQIPELWSAVQSQRRDSASDQHEQTEPFLLEVAA